MNVEATGQRVEDLLDEIAGRDEVAAELTEELLRELMALYGAGLSRILARLAAAVPDALDDLAADPLVGGLLVLHDLHPSDARARVEAALDGVRPYLASHGGGVQVVGVGDGVVRLRLEGSCDGCGSSQVTLQHAVEGAVLEAAPEIARIEVEGAVAPAPAPGGLIPAESLSRRPRDAGPDAGGGGGAGRGGWESLGPVMDDVADVVVARRVGGADLALLRMEQQLYAYRDACPACGGSLAGARVRGDLLACPGCGRDYDVRRAGRAAGDGRGLHPVPLLEDRGGVRISAGALR